MDTLARSFGLPVGYSDHTLGTAVSLAAVARGATVVEKHITLDRARQGPDHAASLEGAELREMVASIRVIEASIGFPAKFPARSERETALVARRSLVAARSLRAGCPLEPADVTALRPGTGRSPMGLWDLIGKPVSRDYRQHEPIDRNE